MDILEFQGENRWLSNFWPACIVFEGVTYPTVENAYQAAKTWPVNRQVYVYIKPGEAKRLGKTMPLRPTWEDEKVSVMRWLIAQKFADGTKLARQLVATEDCRIVEGNSWGDTFWGICRGVGRNTLGKLIMEQREQLKQGN